VNEKHAFPRHLRPDTKRGRIGDRYVYCRHGDIIDELNRIGPAPEKISEGGGDHYLAAFLHFVGDAPTLLLAARPENATCAIENVRARTFRCYRRGGGRWKSHIEEAMLFFRVLQSLISFRPTKILCAKIGPALWACFLYSRWKGAFLVHSRHTRVELLSSNPVRRLWFRMDRWVLQRLPKVICHGPYLYQQLLDIGVRAGNLVQYNVNYRYLLQADLSSGEVPDLTEGETRFIIFFVGRIHENKGVFDLLEAAAPLLERDPRLLLVYAGNGPDFDRLESLVRCQPCASQVKLMGFVEHGQLPALMAQAGVVVTPTRRALTEGWCKVVPESFVLGRPVIAPNFGPFPHMLEDGVDGLLFEVEDVADLRRKLGTVVEDPAYHKRLLTGARKAGERYLMPELDFPGALQEVFGE